jgi:glycerophosphoryl diester phosphodiesterase
MGGDATDAPAFSPSAYAAAAKLSPSIILGLQIRLTRDAQWIVYGPKDWSTLTSHKGLVSRTDSAELPNIRFLGGQEQVLTVAQFLKLYTDRPLWIEILQPATSALTPLFQMLKDAQVERRVVLTSPFYDTTSEIRKNSAQWLSGSATSEVAKARFMNSLYLESLLTLNGDILSDKYFHERLLAELVKRKKIVLIQTDDPEAFRKLPSQDPHIGVLTNRPSRFLP